MNFSEMAKAVAQSANLKKVLENLVENPKVTAIDQIQIMLYLLLINPEKTDQRKIARELNMCIACVSYTLGHFIDLGVVAVNDQAEVSVVQG